MLPFGSMAAGASAIVQPALLVAPQTDGTFGPALHVLLLEL